MMLVYDVSEKFLLATVWQTKFYKRTFLEIVLSIYSNYINFRKLCSVDLLAFSSHLLFFKRIILYAYDLSILYKKIMTGTCQRLFFAYFQPYHFKVRLKNATRQLSRKKLYESSLQPVIQTMLSMP